MNVFTPNPFEFTRPELAGIIASLQDYKLICHSPQLYAELADIMKATFSPHFRRSYGERLKLITYGVGAEFTPGRNDPLRWITPYNRLNEIQKQFRMHSEVMEKVRALVPIQNDVILMQHSRANRDRYEKELAHYNVIDQPLVRDDYPDTLRTYGGFLCTSKVESFGIYYLELLASGAVGVFLDRPWIRQLLPDYPYIVKRDELAAAIHFVIGNYPVARQRVSTYWNREKQRFSIPEFVRLLELEFEDDV